MKGGRPTPLPPIPTSDTRTHELLANIRALLRQTIQLLALQMKGESTFMADINTDLQALKDAVTAETDQTAASNLLLDGVMSTIASGVTAIKDLAHRLLIIADDPQMVRDLAAQLKAATEAQAGKLAALQAASGDLAGAVTANTQGNGSDQGSGPSGPTSEPTGEPVVATDPTNNDIVGPTSQEDINEAATGGNGNL